MKTLSTALLADLITTNRKKLSMTQQSLADATGINRSLISRMEKEDFLPSIPQLEQLGEVLGFEPINVFTDGTQEKKRNVTEPMNIAVAGTGYVGLSIATLLAQHNHVILPLVMAVTVCQKTPSNFLPTTMMFHKI